MNTYFSSAKKMNEYDPAVDIQIASNNPLVSGLLYSLSGLLAVLDDHRHIIALNDSFLFCVWNKQAIPQEIAHRIFQRNFSTKEQAGRGIGTFSMKLFGEQILGGKVNFETSPEKGTLFRFSLPL